MVADAKEPDTFRGLGRLTQAWKAGEVKNVLILYVPRSTHTLSNVRPEALDSDFRYLLIMRDASVRSFCRRLAEVLEKVKVRSSEQKADVRWGLVFQNEKQEKVCSIYVQGVGRNAVVDGADVEMDSDALVAWLNKAFADIFDE